MFDNATFLAAALTSFVLVTSGCAETRPRPDEVIDTGGKADETTQDECPELTPPAPSALTT